MSPKLALKAKALECGYADGPDEDARLLEKVGAAEAAKAGFEGGPDASGRYSLLSNLNAVKQMDESNSKQNIGGY